jgi:signal transduction histidine kinase
MKTWSMTCWRFHRITSGGALRKEPVRLGDIVGARWKTAQPLVLKRRHLLTVSLPPRVWLDADATRLEQVRCEPG